MSTYRYFVITHVPDYGDSGEEDGHRLLIVADYDMISMQPAARVVAEIDYRHEQARWNVRKLDVGRPLCTGEMVTIMKGDEGYWPDE